MKRSSFLLAALSAAACLSATPALYAIDVVPQNTNSNASPYAPTPAPFSGSLSVDPYGFSNTAPTPGASQDPFFNPGNYFNPVPFLPGQANTQTPPSVIPQPPIFTPQNSGTTVPQNNVPNPNPNLYPNDPLAGRDRISPSYNPQNPQPSSRRWRLGVYSRDTDTGVRIEQVVQGSAANRAHLEAQDVIIAVNGYQVGWVTGALFDCSTEFERRADNDGWVALLVQNHRDGKLVNVPVQLESRMQNIQGTLGLDPRQLPKNAIVQVELREIVRPEAPPVTVASTRVADVSKYPIPFKIEYDPLQVDSRRSYVVTANVTNNGQLLFETRQTYPVLAPGQPKQVALALDRVQINNQIPQPRTPMDRNQQMAQIRQWFRDYLQRNPTQNELTLWMQALDNGYSLPDVQVELLSQNQVFNQVNRDKQQYIVQLHRFMIGRDPTPEELSYWVAKYDESGGLRRDLARDFQAAVSAR